MLEVSLADDRSVRLLGKNAAKMRSEWTYRVAIGYWTEDWRALDTIPEADPGCS